MLLFICKKKKKKFSKSNIRKKLKLKISINSVYWWAKKPKLWKKLEITFVDPQGFTGSFLRYKSYLFINKFFQIYRGVLQNKIDFCSSDDTIIMNSSVTKTSSRFTIRTCQRGFFQVFYLFSFCWCIHFLNHLFSLSQLGTIW